MRKSDGGKWTVAIETVRGAIFQEMGIAAPPGIKRCGAALFLWSGGRGRAMTDLERLGRNVVERVGQVMRDGLDRAVVALQPLIEQLLQRLVALRVLLDFLARLILAILLAPLGDALGKAIGAFLKQLLALILGSCTAAVTVTCGALLLISLVLIFHGRSTCCPSRARSGAE